MIVCVKTTIKKGCDGCMFNIGNEPCKNPGKKPLCVEICGHGLEPVIYKEVDDE